MTLIWVSVKSGMPQSDPLITLKTEHVYYHPYRAREEARQSLFEYIEVIYNRKRRHSTLNYMTPIEYERY